MGKALPVCETTAVASLLSVNERLSFQSTRGWLE